MKKSLLKIAGTAICMFLAGVNAAGAYDFEDNNIFYTVTSDRYQTVEVASAQYTGNLVIPEYASDGSNTYTVTGLAMGAFAENGNLTGVTLPSTLTTIGNSAFYACLGLKEIVIPQSVTYIGIQAFISCANLQEVNIPAAVETIGSDAFLGCSALKAINIDANNKNYTSIDGVMFDKAQTTLIKYPASKGTSYTIPSTVKTLETNAFFGAGSLAEVTIPEGVETISGYAFCGAGLRNVTIPSTVKGDLGRNAFRDCQFLTSIDFKTTQLTTIGEGSFYNARALQTITIPEGVTAIGANAFEISALREIKVPSTLKTLGAGVFSQCYNFSEILLPDGFETIGDQAFYGCGSLRAIRLPKGLTSIGGRAFEGCYALTTINIPATTSSIGASAFTGCSALTSITVDDANQTFSSVDGILYDKNHTSILACPMGITGDIEIPEGVTDLGEAVFSGCYNLTGIKLPNTLANIGFMAFYNCQGLKQVFIPAGVKSIGNTAFGNCYALNTIICAVPEPLPLQEYTFNGLGTWAIDLYVPEASVEAYKSAPIWSGFVVKAAEEGMIPGDNQGDFQLLNTFDFNAMDPEKTPTSNNGHEGDITENIVMTEGVVSLTITPNPNGTIELNNMNRFYLYQDKVQLRMYGGTLTFSVPDGVLIKQIEVFKVQWNANNNVDGSPLTGENKTTAPRYWNGSAQNVVVNIVNNSQINTINVTLEDTTNGIETVVPVEIEYVEGEAYDLSGKIVSPDTKGVLIRRAVMQNGSVKMVKVLNK